MTKKEKTPPERVPVSTETPSPTPKLPAEQEKIPRTSEPVISGNSEKAVSQQRLDLLNKIVTEELRRSHKLGAHRIRFGYKFGELANKRGRTSDTDTANRFFKAFEPVQLVKMKHADLVSKRITELGGTATTKVDDQKFLAENIVSDLLEQRSIDSETIAGLKKTIEQDIKQEEEAIRVFEEAIMKFTEEGDEKTAQLLGNILKEKREVLSTFFTLLLAFVSECSD